MIIGEKPKEHKYRHVRQRMCDCDPGKKQWCNRHSYNRMREEQFKGLADYR